MTCKADLHSVAMCDKQWMPNDGDYFCSKACVQKHNYSDEGREADKMPLRRRPDAEEVEPDAAEADQAQQRKPTKRRGVDLTAAATRPRRDTAGPATTGAMQKTVGLGAFFNPVAAPKNAAAKKATAPKGRAPVGQPTLKAAVTQVPFLRQLDLGPSALLPQPSGWRRALHRAQNHTRCALLRLKCPTRDHDKSSASASSASSSPRSLATSLPRYLATSPPLSPHATA